MESQEYCLKWDNHHGNLTTFFDDFLLSEKFVDVDITCEGKFIKAHKIVLSACSPFFKEIFSNNPCKHPVVFMNDVNFFDLQAIIEFIYKGQVNVNQKQLPSLLKVASSLQIKGLADFSDKSKCNETFKPPAEHEHSIHQSDEEAQSQETNPSESTISSQRCQMSNPQNENLKDNELSMQDIKTEQIMDEDEDQNPSQEHQGPPSDNLEKIFTPIINFTSPSSLTPNHVSNCEMPSNSNYNAFCEQKNAQYSQDSSLSGLNRITFGESTNEDEKVSGPGDCADPTIKFEHNAACSSESDPIFSPTTPNHPLPRPSYTDSIIEKTITKIAAAVDCYRERRTRVGQPVQWTKYDLRNAMYAVIKFNIGVTAAARKYGIPQPTLSCYLSKYHKTYGLRGNV
ncbi:Protein bric-a-brac 2 [Nymphon striatum]|nr:Protein bric-a-brac 2 [Nymphon striatum]